MSTPPKSVLVAGFLFTTSAVYGLITGTLGLELHTFHVAQPIAVAFALLHVYVGLGLLGRDGFARSLALWLLAIGFFGSFYAMFEVVHEHAQTVNAIAPNVVNVLVVSFFLWQLSSADAVAYAPTGGGRDEHDGHAHAH